MIRLRRQSGLSLFEMVLFLTVAASLVIVGLKVYSNLQETTQIQELRANVDQLMQAAGNYYRANCAAGALAASNSNFLSPYVNIPSNPFNGNGTAYPPASTGYLYVSIPSTLVANGYLTNWVPTNPLVDTSGGDSGYIVQLNPVIMSSIPVNACVVLVPGTPNPPPATPTPCVPSTPTSTIAANQAKIVFWEVQVAVKLVNPSRINSFVAASGADCHSAQTSGSSSSAPTVDPCPSADSSPNYMVWVRAPSFATIEKSSAFSTMTPMLTVFNEQYTEDPNYALSAGYTGTQGPVYYLCGG